MLQVHKLFDKIEMLLRSSSTAIGATGLMFATLASYQCVAADHKSSLQSNLEPEEQPSCAPGLDSIAQGDPTHAAADSAFFKIVTVAEFDAPLDWLWKNWPLRFDISKVMNDDPSGENSTIGVVSQRVGPSADGRPFNNVGSHIYYTLVGGRQVDEVVLQRDHDHHIYEYVYSLGFADAQGHMIYEATGKNTSKITWTYWIKPKSDEAKQASHNFLNEVWGPFIANHACPNLELAVEGLYSGDESYADPSAK